MARTASHFYGDRRSWRGDKAHQRALDADERVVRIATVKLRRDAIVINQAHWHELQTCAVGFTLVRQPDGRRGMPGPGELRP